MQCSGACGNRRFCNVNCLEVSHFFVVDFSPKTGLIQHSSLSYPVQNNSSLDGKRRIHTLICLLYSSFDFALRCLPFVSTNNKLIFSPNSLQHLLKRYAIYLSNPQHSFVQPNFEIFQFLVNCPLPTFHSCKRLHSSQIPLEKTQMHFSRQRTSSEMLFFLRPFCVLYLPYFDHNKIFYSFIMVYCRLLMILDTYLNISKHITNKSFH